VSGVLSTAEFIFDNEFPDCYLPAVSNTNTVIFAHI